LIPAASGVDPAIYTAVAATTIGFYRAVDLRLPEAEEFFLEQGEWDRLGTVLRGRAAIRAALAERSPTRKTCHLVNNLVVSSAQADQAQAEFFVAVYESVDEAPLRMMSILAAQDRLVRTSAGWRIQFRTAYRHLTTTGVARHA
jgi:SnoaL-like domain